MRANYSSYQAGRAGAWLAILLFALVVFLGYCNYGKLPRVAGVQISNRIAEHHVTPYTTVELGELNSFFIDTTGKLHPVTVNLCLAVEMSREDRGEDVSGEINIRRPQLLDAINTSILEFDLAPLLSNASGVRAKQLEALRATVIRSINARMHKQIDTLFFRDFVIHETAKVSDSGVIIVPHGAEVADNPPASILPSFSDIIGPGLSWILAYFAALLSVARPKEIFTRIFGSSTFVPAASDKHFRAFAADSAILVGILLTTMKMIYVLEHLGAGGEEEFFSETIGAHTALVCGISAWLILKSKVFFNPEPSAACSEFPETPMGGGWLLPLGISVAIYYFMGISFQAFFNSLAVIILIAPYAIQRILHRLPVEDRILIAERARIAIGYSFIAAGSLSVFGEALSSHPKLEDLGNGVAVAFVSVVFMVVGSLIARIRAAKRVSGVIAFPSAWSYTLTSLLLANLMAVIILAARSIEK